ncbi:type B DNA-directed DNA polymerase [Methanoregula sp.]|uniref:type B DNA-directed DNA polymerase n=1 Tax=Methanoregula sp. TaxID=2052170 RepID=UPI000CA89B36|nr:type B DNA-directed DNA polymerase [Methanoregula sp.]PKG32982.1 MAG: DNA polymerase I [Methanoregula sp.]
MWILDSAYRNGGIDLWTKEGGAVTRVHHPYDPPFLVHFTDPHASHDMIDALEERYNAEECTIRTVFGSLPGYRVFADRRVAEVIEEQAQYDVQLFNVDVRRDQRFMAEHGIFPCSGNNSDRFYPEIFHDLDVITIRIHGEPERSATLPEVEVVHERIEHFSGPEGTVLSALFSRISSLDPDVILMPDADAWMPRLQRLAQDRGLVMPFSRNGKYRSMNSRSYWSYGKMEHKDAALVPDGRILIDTERSFVFREGGLEGVLMSARLSGLSPNLVSRFTPGTLISSYETYEAIRWDIAVPFRKSDGETIRRISTLQAADRGGMMFQPRPGVFWNVEEIDFTSMYPSIIVQENLSPETIGHPEQPGFLPAVLKPLLDLRIRTKQLKKTDPAFNGTDSILKWMLVTCFGYTGYKNAKFGRIEVHEGITRQSRELLIKTKDIAEEMGFSVLHGIVDCLWVQGAHVSLLKARVEQETRLHLECEHFDWIVFLPLADGFGAYNRYFGRLPDGSVKVRGIAARRHDTPEFIRAMQQEMLTEMGRAGTVAELDAVWDTVRGIYRKTIARLPSASGQEMAISRRISRLNYAHRCIEGAAVRAYREQGASVAPGMKIHYVVTDAKRYQAEPVWAAKTFDQQYYRGLLDKAWEEIAFAFRKRNQPACQPEKCANLSAW